MSALNLSATMDAIAQALLDGSVTERAYAWPAESIAAPCAVVGYPEDDIEFDTTFSRGSDRALIPVYLLVGKATERTARDRLSTAISAAKAALDGDLGGAVQTARLATMRIQEVAVAGTPYLAAIAKVEVYT